MEKVSEDRKFIYNEKNSLKNTFDSDAAGKNQNQLENQNPSATPLNK